MGMPFLHVLAYVRTGVASLSKASHSGRFLAFICIALLRLTCPHTDLPPGSPLLWTACCFLIFLLSGYCFYTVIWGCLYIQVEKVMATHSSILAWKALWTKELGGLQSTGSQTVGHCWVCTLIYIQDVPLCQSLNVTNILSHLRFNFSLKKLFIFNWRIIALQSFCFLK